MACSPELGTTEGYSFKIDLHLLWSSCFGIFCFLRVLKCMYNYKKNFLRTNQYAIIYGLIEYTVYKWPPILWHRATAYTETQFGALVTASILAISVDKFGSFRVSSTMVCESPLRIRWNLAHLQIMPKKNSVNIFRDVGRAVSEIWPSKKWKKGRFLRQDPSIKCQ